MPGAESLVEGLRVDGRPAGAEGLAEKVERRLKRAAHGEFHDENERGRDEERQRDRDDLIAMAREKGRHMG